MLTADDSKKAVPLFNLFLQELHRLGMNKESPGYETVLAAIRNILPGSFHDLFTVADVCPWLESTVDQPNNLPKFLTPNQNYRNEITSWGSCKEAFPSNPTTPQHSLLHLGGPALSIISTNPSDSAPLQYSGPVRKETFGKTNESIRPGQQSAVKRTKRIPVSTSELMCDVCSKVFKNRYGLRCHYRSHTGEKPFKCTWEDCEKSYSERSDLTRHAQTHTGSFRHKCSVEGCTRGFARLGYLRIHLRSHTGDRPFTCSVEGCGKSFVSQGSFKTHTMNHSDDLPFKCTVDGCGRSFRVPSLLVSHVITHTRERPFKCAWKDCKKSFSQKSSLNVHMRTHTGEKAFKCEVEGCGKSFTIQRLLKNHGLTHSGEKPFKCKECDKSFSQRCNLNRHIKTHSGSSKTNSK